jgi:hypothetical protein
MEIEVILFAAFNLFIAMDCLIANKDRRFFFETRTLLKKEVAETKKKKEIYSDAQF